jgi:hypothetical protein
MKTRKEVLHNQFSGLFVGGKFEFINKQIFTIIHNINIVAWIIYKNIQILAVLLIIAEGIMENE